MNPFTVTSNNTAGWIYPTYQQVLESFVYWLNEPGSYLPARMISTRCGGDEPQRLTCYQPPVANTMKDKIPAFLNVVGLK